ncbi:MAG TPA: hypothetical protein VGM37_18455 [Armatimonadota bacterium]|jgi:hypothetical protein
MKWTTIGWGVAALAAAAAGAGKGCQTSYCRHCGLERSDSGFTYWRQPVRWRSVTSETPFHRQYARIVSPQCRHTWFRASHGRADVFGWMVACREMPSLMYSEDLASRLQRLPRQRARALLMRYDLTGRDWAANRRVEVEIMKAKASRR